MARLVVGQVTLSVCYRERTVEGENEAAPISDWFWAQIIEKLMGATISDREPRPVFKRAGPRYELWSLLEEAFGDEV